MRARPGSRISQRPFLRYFVPQVIAVTVAVALGTAFLAWTATNSHEQTVRSAEMDLVSGIGASFTQALVGAASDVAMLARDEALRDLPPVPTAADLDRVAAVFTDVASVRGSYDHVRLLDTDGMEVVRVDHANGRSVRTTELQDKSSRYYFTDAIGLAAGEIYVSPLDLNVEQGQVEVPHTPMIRFATPLLDTSGARRGVVVVNYLGAEAITALREEAGRLDRSFHLVNSDGYWLATPDSDAAWGWMLGNEDARLPVVDPGAWAAMTAADEGQEASSAGLYTWRRLAPLDELTAAQGTVVSPAPATLTWTAYSLIDAETLATGVAAARRDALAIGLVVGLALLIPSALASWSLGRQWLHRRELHALVEELQDSRTTTTLVLQTLYHDLRSPLATMSVAASTLTDPRLDDDQRSELLDVLHRSLDRAAAVIDGVRLLEQSDSGTLTPRRTTVDVTSLLEGVAARIDTVDHPVTVIDEVGEADLDPVIIERSIENLLSNAIVHTPPSTAVELRADAVNGGVRFLVHDHGPGVEQDVLERALEARPRSSDSSSTGYGLGLSLANRYAVAHGGHLEIDAAPGRGTRIAVVVPAHDPSARDTTLREEA